MKLKASMLTLGAAVSLGGLVAATMPAPAHAACSAKMAKCGGMKMGKCGGKKAAKCASKDGAKTGHMKSSHGDKM